MGFDPVARVYHTLEYCSFGGALQRARLAHMQEFLAAREVLLLGDGDGRFLEALLLAAAETGIELGPVISVDASGRMLELARERVSGLPGAERVMFCHSEIERFQPPSGFRADIVAAHFVLDCFEEAELVPLLEHVGGWMATDGRMVVSDFGRPRGLVPGVISRVVLWGMVLFFRLTTQISARRLPDLEEVLGRGRWRQVEAGRRRWLGGFLFSDLWEKGS